MRRGREVKIERGGEGKRMKNETALCNADILLVPELGIGGVIYADAEHEDGKGEGARIGERDAVGGAGTKVRHG